MAVAPLSRLFGPLLALALVGVALAPAAPWPVHAQSADGAPTRVTQPAGPVRARRSGDEVFDLTRVHEIRVSMSESEWRVLQTSSARGATGQPGEDYTAADGRLIHVGGGFRGYYPWVHATLRLDGTEVADAGVRYKGNSSFSSSSAAAPLRANFKIKLDLFGSKTDWHGLETLNLHAGVLDTTLIREALAYAVFRRAGVPAPRTAYADAVFSVPGVLDNVAGGRYVLIENVNRRFLRNELPPGDGLLMKPEGMGGGIRSFGNEWVSYAAVLRPEREATAHEQRRVIEFAQLVSNPDVAQFRSRIAEYVDVDELLRYLAVNAFLGNWDSYLSGNHNVYLYLDPSDDRIRFLPWDEDLSMGARFGRGPIDISRPMVGSQTLIYWLLDDPAIADRYRTVLRELATTAFSGTELFALLDRLETVVGPNGGAIRSFIEDRLRSLDQTLAATQVP